jgi:hypothetical protein
MIKTENFIIVKEEKFNNIISQGGIRSRSNDSTISVYSHGFNPLYFCLIHNNEFTNSFATDSHSVLNHSEWNEIYNAFIAMGLINPIIKND